MPRIFCFLAGLVLARHLVLQRLRVARTCRARLRIASTAKAQKTRRGSERRRVGGRITRSTRADVLVDGRLDRGSNGRFRGGGPHGRRAESAEGVSFTRSGGRREQTLSSFDSHARVSAAPAVRKYVQYADRAAPPPAVLVAPTFSRPRCVVAHVFCAICLAEHGPSVGLGGSGGGSAPAARTREKRLP